MLASIHRLSKDSDFERIRNDGKLYQRGFFGAQVLKKEGQETSRFAFVVSTKISKQSVQRNRVRRAMREAVRHQLYIIGKGFDIIFLPKKEIARKSTEEIMREVQKFILKELA